MLVAEVGEQRPAAAVGDLAPAEQRVELLAIVPLVLLVGVGVVDHLPQAHDVLQSVDHPCVGRLAVAPGAAGFLVVGLDALRQVEMGDEAHVGPVDPHAEGDGGNDDHIVLGEEAVLVFRPHLRAQAGVVRQGVVAVLPE